ncbi:MAG TPA: hypothetical protein PKY12_03555 [Catalimonadaceae bacterium]|nr:hypothetical protein [Catalimonadaceae bacterium]
MKKIALWISFFIVLVGGNFLVTSATIPPILELTEQKWYSLIFGLLTGHLMWFVFAVAGPLLVVIFSYQIVPHKLTGSSIIFAFFLFIIIFPIIVRGGKITFSMEWLQIFQNCLGLALSGFLVWVCIITKTEDERKEAIKY